MPTPPSASTSISADEVARKLLGPSVSLPPPSTSHSVAASPRHPGPPASNRPASAGASRSSSFKTTPAGRPTSLGHQLAAPTTADTKTKTTSTAKLSPRLIRKLQIVKSGISFVSNLKMGDQPPPQ